MMQPGLALQNALCLIGTKRFDCPVVIFPIEICRVVCRTITPENIVERAGSGKNMQAL